MVRVKGKEGFYEIENGDIKWYSEKPRKVRGFEKVSYAPTGTQTPVRKTKLSSCYDMFMPYGLTIGAGCTSKPIPLNIKAYMMDDEVLEIQVRSSIGMKKHLILPNSPAQIDADYYNCEENEGNISIVLVNIGDRPQTLEKGERVVQAKFTKYLLADDDETTEERKGGTGSTGR